MDRDRDSSSSDEDFFEELARLERNVHLGKILTKVTIFKMLR